MVPEGTVLAAARHTGAADVARSTDKLAEHNLDDSSEWITEQGEGIADGALDDAAAHFRATVAVEDNRQQDLVLQHTEHPADHIQLQVLVVHCNPPYVGD